MKVLIHNDGGKCQGTPLNDNGECPVCGLTPDMQSTALVDIEQPESERCE